MPEKKPPQKPTNLRPYECDLVINGQHLTKLEISPYYEKHNREYWRNLEKKKAKGIKITDEQLKRKIISDELICELVKKLDGEEEIVQEGRFYHWTYYSFITFADDKAYKLVWCFDDYETNIIGVVNCYRIGKYDRDKLNQNP
jgi:hypothetical protein